MGSWTTQVWVALIGAVGVIAGIVGNRTGNRADAAAKLSSSALDQVASMRTDLTAERERGDRLEVAVDALRRELRVEREWCDLRINQLAAALHAEGIDVPPPPTRPQ
jgi:hypothetical protein